MNKSEEFPSEISLEAESRPKTIIEIGVGNFSAYDISHKLDEEIKNGAEYIGVDLNKEELEIVKDGGQEAVIGDLSKLPFKDNSADEIWLNNVFGSGPRLISWRNSKGGWTYDLGAGKYFKELARVTKPGGEVIIGEYIYPVNDVDKIVDWDYEKFGFDKEVFGGEKLKVFLEKHKISSNLAKYGNAKHPFFLVLKRRK